MEQKNRVTHFEYLRAFATIAVILLHVAGHNWSIVDVNSIEWSLFNLFDSIARWGVPVFIMISGALFLSKPLNFKRICRRNIPRLAIAYLAWSLFYAAFFPVLHLLLREGYNFPLLSVLKNTIQGHYHLWFLPMMLGLYLCLPVLHPIAQNLKTTRYFLCLALIFGLALPQAANIARDFFPGIPLSIVNAASSFIGDMHMDLFMGFPVYFLLGHLLNTTEFSARQRKTIYVLGLVGVLSTLLLTSALSHSAQVAKATYYGNMNLNILLQAVAVFVFFKENFKAPGRCFSLIQKLSRYSFGIYLSHAFILSLLASLGLDTLSFHPLLSVPAITILVGTGAFIVSFILNRIPILNKYIV